MTRPGTWAGAWLALAALLPFVGACADPQLVGSDCDVDAGCGVGGMLVGNDASTMLPALPVPVKPVEQLDLLFVVDDDPASAPLQGALAQAAPALLRALHDGQLDGAGFPEFHPVTDVVVGVVSGNMGGDPLAGGGCAPPGDDGALQTRSADPACMEHAQLLSLGAGDGPALACALRLGDAGCGAAQPLEALRRRLQSPQSIPFPRPDSMLVVVIASLLDDCSTDDPTLLGSDLALLPPVLAELEPRMRCVAAPERQKPIAEFVDLLLQERAADLDRLLVVAIGALPPELVDADARAGFDFEDSADRTDFYGALLQDPRMVYRSDIGAFRTSLVCGAADPARITPARRLTGFAQQLGQRGLLLSGCADAATLQTQLLHGIGRHLGLAGL